MELMENQKIENWLCESRTANTKRSYILRITRFFSWYKGTVEEFLLLEQSERRNILLKFQNAQTNENHNSVNAYVAAVLSFLRSVDKPLSLKGKTLRPTMDLSSHSFTNGDLTRMFEVADLKEKALLSLSVSLGWEVSAVVALKRCFIESLITKAKEDNQHFVYWLSQREKTGAPRLGVLNPLALEWVSKWLVECKRHPKRKRLLTPKREYGVSDIFDVTAAGANKIICRLAKQAGITTTGRVHFHKLRGWVMSGLSRAGFNEFQIKFLMGKTIPLTDMTYLETLKQELEEKYPAAYEATLSIKTDVPVKALNALTKDLKEIQLENSVLREKMRRMEVSREGIEALLSRVLELERKLGGNTKP